MVKGLSRDRRVHLDPLAAFHESIRLKRFCDCPSDALSLKRRIHRDMKQAAFGFAVPIRSDCAAADDCNVLKRDVKMCAPRDNAYPWAASFESSFPAGISINASPKG